MAHILNLRLKFVPNVVITVKTHPVYAVVLPEPAIIVMEELYWLILKNVSVVVPALLHVLMMHAILIPTDTSINAHFAFTV
jgi:hypothetical protein